MYKNECNSFVKDIARKTFSQPYTVRGILKKMNKYVLERNCEE